MISTEQYKAIISDLMDELPEAFYRNLTGGVIMSEALVIPDYAQGNNLYTLGQYQVCYGLRQIVMFKGSFDRLYPNADVPETRDILRGVLRHEFRHHIEFLGGIHNASSLEAEDERQKQAYLAHHDEKGKKDGNCSVRRAIRGGASAEAPLRIARECRGDALIARVKRICGLNSYKR